MKKYNYRKSYEDYFGIKIPPGFEIHHINGDRENNSIDNLIMLPGWLHHKLHFSCEALKDIKCADIPGLIGQNHTITWILSSLETLTAVKEDFSFWAQAKENEIMLKMRFPVPAFGPSYKQFKLCNTR